MYDRYVDDTLVAFNGNSRQIEMLHGFLNNITPKLKFTLEIEKNNAINFLDLTLHKIDKKFEFKIYRKPTTSNQTIHATSYHPMPQKLAAYNSMVHRLLHVPLNQDQYIHEVNIIKHIAIANGFKSSMVDRLISKHRASKYRVNNIDGIKYACVEYSHNINNTLKKELQKEKIQLAFRTTNHLKNFLTEKQKSKNKFANNGVYKIKCADCPSVYIGQTGRSFQTRFKEHWPNRKINKQKSTFAQHLIDSNHNVEPIEDSLEVLHVCRKGRKLDSLEEFEIYKIMQDKDVRDHSINDKQFFRSHQLFQAMLKVQRQNKNTATDNAGMNLPTTAIT